MTFLASKNVERYERVFWVNIHPQADHIDRSMLISVIDLLKERKSVNLPE